MPLFRKSKKPVDKGLSDLPEEVDENYETNNPAALSPEEKEEEEARLRGTRQKMRNSKDNNRSPSTRLQEAEIRRNQMKLARQIPEDNNNAEEEENEDAAKIETLLGVTETGCCKKHTMFLIRSGSVEKSNRFETILDCKLCRQDSMQVQQEKKDQLYRFVDAATGQVKQFFKNPTKMKWKDKKNQGTYKSDEGDIDGAWKEQASLRLDQVLTWDIDNGPLKSNPQYAKYFRMIKDGSDVRAVREICKKDGMNPRVLDFDPFLPLEQQLNESTVLSQTTKDEIRLSALGEGTTPEELYEAVNNLHKLYVKKYNKEIASRPPPTPRGISPTKSLVNSIASSFAIRPTTVKKEAAPITELPSSSSAANNSMQPNSMATPVIATPVKATPVQNKSSSGKPIKKATPKMPMDEKEFLREKEMQEIRELHQDQREAKERRREKRKVDKLTGLVKGKNQKRNLKLLRAMEQLELTKDQLLGVRLKVDEKNAQGTDLIAQIQMLQIQFDERTKYQKALSTRVNDLRKERGMPPRQARRMPPRRVESTDDTSTGSYDGFGEYSPRQKSDRSLGSSVPIPLAPGDYDDKMISISDKLRADDDDEENENDTPRTRKRKSARSGRRRRKSNTTVASKRSVASKRREPNFDPEFLIEKFQEAIRKLITINRFFQQANDLAMAKESNVDQKSFGMRKSVLTDLVLPDFNEDEEWEYYDVEIEEDEDFDEDEFDGDESTVDSLGPLPSFGRNSLQSMPLFSPAGKNGRKSLVLKRSPSVASIPAPPPVNPDSKVRWNDDKLYTVRVIPRLPEDEDLFYTTDEIKLFRFEKFMDDNADEFEVVDDEEWEEEEIIEDDDYSIESFDDESYYSQDESVKSGRSFRRSSDGAFASNKKGWSYDESMFEIKPLEAAAPASTNENEAKPIESKPASVDTIFRERSPNTEDKTDLTSQASANILDDLIDQVDALIKRKTSEFEPTPSMAKESATASRGLPEMNIKSDQQAPDEDPASEPNESLAALADDEIQELRRTFHAFDTNGSGYIEHDELKANLKTVGYNINEEGIDNLLSMVDSKDGRLNFEEFIAWNRVLWKDDMNEKFKAIDAKNRGYIDQSQLKAYVVDLGHGFTDEELEELCYEMDPEGNDRILLDGFINVMAASRAGNSYCVVNGELYIEKLKTDFQSMDTDDTGYITRENLQEMATQSDYILSEKELDETMKELDLDGNGQISIDEFIAASVRIKDPSAAEEPDQSSSSDGFASGKGGIHRLSESRMSLLDEGKGGLETVLESKQEHQATEAEKYRQMIARLEAREKSSKSEAGDDEETPKASPKSSIASTSETEAGDDEEIPKASPKSSIASTSENTENSVHSKVAATGAKEKNTLSNFFGRTSQNQQAIRQGSKSSLSYIDQKRTVEMNKSNEVSLADLSVLTSDVFGSDSYSVLPSPDVKEQQQTESTKVAPGTEAFKNIVDNVRTKIGALAAEDTPSEADGNETKKTEEVFVPPANTRMSSITVDETLKNLDDTPDKTEERKTASAPAPEPAAKIPDIFKERAKAPAPAPVVPNAFKKKSQFLRESDSKMPKKKAILKRESTGGSKSSMSMDDWSSDGGGDETDTPRSSRRQESQNNDPNNASLPLIIMGDKLEADKEAGVDGIAPKKRRRKRRTSKKKPEREPNLDPQFLRDTFKQRIRKLISLNRFFQQATDAKFDKEMGTDRKSFATTGSGLSLLNKLSASDITEMDELYDSDDSDGETDEVGSMVSFGLSGVTNAANAHAGGRGLNRELSTMSMQSTTCFIPPAISAQPKRSSVMTQERKEARAGINVGFKPESKMLKVKLVPFLTDEQTQEFFWTEQELKLFRFEKFMEDNSNEFALVDDDEVEYEEEEFEEVSWVSGDVSYDEVSYEEETIAED
ncbi:unnamed protein product [Cylindrotheca closterium]|uniref:EF-hand domain-containing protein n=1 Tax=Cylindrotheca closterium TaxID=2856 RepID=A0AAD2CQZ7_9STRA|nr:unnamed protein product [Cylindrotheca closterium]